MAIYKIKIQFAVLWFNLDSFEEKTLQESRYREAYMNVLNSRVLTDCILILESNVSVT